MVQQFPYAKDLRGEQLFVFQSSVQLLDVQGDEQKLVMQVDVPQKVWMVRSVQMGSLDEV